MRVLVGNFADEPLFAVIGNHKNMMMTEFNLHQQLQQKQK